MKTLPILLLMLTTFAGNSFNIFAQQRKAKSGKSSSARTAPKYTVDSIDHINWETIEQLPAEYLGHSIKTVYEGLSDRARKMEKSEYESRHAYEQRVKQETDAPILGTLKLSSLFAFSTQVSKSSYDADFQTLQVMLSPKYRKAGILPLTNRGDEYKEELARLTKALEFDSDRKDKGSYTGSNAYGAERVIEKVWLTTYYLGIPDSKNQTMEDNIYIVCTLSVNEVKTYRERLRVMIVGHLSSPYIGYDINTAKPTIDNPIELTWFKHQLYFTPKIAILYDFLTGRIIQRHRLPNTLPKD